MQPSSKLRSEVVVLMPFSSICSRRSDGRRRRRIQIGTRKGKPKSARWRVLVSLAAVTFIWLILLLLMHQNLSAFASDHSPCEAIYFWGGGKAGSTTLAALLKHDYNNSGYDPNSEFIDSPKEICWALQKRRGFGSEIDSLSKWRGMTHGKKCHPDDRRFVLDACPRYSTKEQAQAIIEENPHAKFLMLIRNPVDRLVSHINDVRRGPTVDVEEVVKKLLKRNVAGGIGWDGMNDSNTKTFRGRNGNHDLPRDRLIEKKFDHVSQLSRSHWELSLYGKNLRNLLNVVPSSQVLVIQTEALSRNPQETMANILSYIGANKSKKVKALHENQLHDRTSYKTISPELRLELEAAFRADHLLLLQLLRGKTFAWSWVADGSNSSAVSDWLTTTPGDIDNRAVG